MSNQVARSVQQHMGTTEYVLHAVAMLCTLGFWYPVYRHRKNKLARTTVHYAG